MQILTARAHLSCSPSLTVGSLGGDGVDAACGHARHSGDFSCPRIHGKQAKAASMTSFHQVALCPHFELCGGVRVTS